MYYHCRELKYVTYGKIIPPPREVVDEDMLRVYDWLGNHCGYSPQIWLSRSSSNITGFKRKSNRFKKWQKDEWILFGFENIQGFGLDYGRWDYLISTFLCGSTIKRSIEADLKEALQYGWEKDDEDFYKTLREYKTLGEEEWLKKYLFVENDQVVVPSLNLKSAKVVFCKNEKQKKKLKKMGFIDDRIQIRNLKNQSGW